MDKLTNKNCLFLPVSGIFLKAATNFFIPMANEEIPNDLGSPINTIPAGSPQRRPWQATVEEALDDKNPLQVVDADCADLLEDINLEYNPNESIKSDSDDSDDEPGGEAEAECVQRANEEKDMQWSPPTVEAVKEGHKKIKDLIHPPQNTGKGYKDPKLDLVLRSRLEAMMRFMWAYINSKSPCYDKWEAASLDTAWAAERGPYFAR